VPNFAISQLFLMPSAAIGLFCRGATDKLPNSPRPTGAALVGKPLRYTVCQASCMLAEADKLHSRQQPRAPLSSIGVLTPPEPADRMPCMSRTCWSSCLQHFRKWYQIGLWPACTCLMLLSAPFHGHRLERKHGVGMLSLQMNEPINKALLRCIWYWQPHSLRNRTHPWKLTDGGILQAGPTAWVGITAALLAQNETWWKHVDRTC
jgi:hypothetical protein